ncbi:MAG: glycosyltransferase family 4 protein, partial [Acidobacteriota bacterium]|nr:glycosyltransferase family 4 protein [Acidobacteriota bacterium]
MGKRSLRILSVYDCVYPESLGGIEHRNLEMAAALARRGHQVTLAGWAAAPSSPFPGVTVRPLSYRTHLYNRAGKRRMTAALRLSAAMVFVELDGFDLVETANVPYLHLFPLALRCRLRRTPLVVSWYEHWGRYWADYLGSWKWPLFAAVEWLAAQLGRNVNAVSALTAERLTRARLAAGEIAILPSGIPIASIQEASTQNKDGPPLVYAGRLMAEKRIDLLLRAVARLASSTQGELLKIIGDGPDRDRLEKLAVELGIEPQVRFFGQLPNSKSVWRELGRSLVAVQPSSREGFGLFPLEAMAAGLPVVCCDSAESAVPELVRNEQEGLVCQATPASLASALERLLSCPSLAARLEHNARRRASEYDWDHIGERVESLSYQWLAAK